VVTIDFITMFLGIERKHNFIIVVVEKIAKDAHLIQVKIAHKETNIVDIYMKEIARLHGLPKEIVSDSDDKFTSNFWKGLFKGFATNLNFSTTYHPESDG
jgi:hypothetical protein